MGVEELAAFFLKAAGKLGVKRCFRPSLKFGDVVMDPIRASGDSHQDGRAALYTMEVENVGVKSAENCRAYLTLHGIRQIEDTESILDVQGFQVDEIEGDEFEYIFDSQIFWSDNVRPGDYLEEDLDASSETTIANGESAELTFAALLPDGSEDENHWIRFPGPDGFSSAPLPELSIDRTPVPPASIGGDGNPNQRTSALKVESLSDWNWVEAKISVTCENTIENGQDFEFVYPEDGFDIRAVE